MHRSRNVWGNRQSASQSFGRPKFLDGCGGEDGARALRFPVRAVAGMRTGSPKETSDVRSFLIGVGEYMTCFRRRFCSSALGAGTAAMQGGLRTSEVFRSEWGRSADPFFPEVAIASLAILYWTQTVHQLRDLTVDCIACLPDHRQPSECNLRRGLKFCVSHVDECEWTRPRTALFQPVNHRAR